MAELASRAAGDQSLVGGTDDVSPVGPRRVSGLDAKIGKDDAERALEGDRIRNLWAPITQMRTRNVGWPAGDVPGRARLRDVEVSAKGAADEVTLGGVFFVGAPLKGVPQLWVESDGDDL